MKFEEQIKQQFAEATGKKFEDMVQAEVDIYRVKVRKAIKELEKKAFNRYVFDNKTNQWNIVRVIQIDDLMEILKI